MAAPGRPMRKGRNGCAIAFRLGTREEELGFSPKVSLFFSSGSSLRAARVPHHHGENLIVLWEFIPNLCNKIGGQNLSGALKQLLFFMASPMGRRVQKGRSKLQGNSMEVYEERSKRVCYSLWH